MNDVNSWFRDKSGETAIQSVHTTICYTIVCNRCVIEMMEMFATNQLLIILLMLV
jgi:hypothetical protein